MFFQVGADWATSSSHELTMILHVTHPLFFWKGTRKRARMSDFAGDIFFLKKED